MRSSLKSYIAIAAAVLVAPSFVNADDMGGGDDLQEVLSRMSDLEQQLRATNDSLAAANARVDQQQRMLSKMGSGAPAGAMPALSDFLTETTFGGWVSASYFYNTNNPNSEETDGANLGPPRDGLGNAFHGNSNSFQVDEVWFAMSNEATPESRGGFEIDVAGRFVNEHSRSAILGKTLRDVALDLAVLSNRNTEGLALVRVADHYV